MKALILPMLLLSIVMNGCSSTYKWEVTAEVVPESKPEKPTPKAPPPVVLPKNILPSYIGVTSSGPNHFGILNKSKKNVFVVYKESVAQVGINSYRVVSGSAKKINSDMSSPDSPIAPKTFSDLTFYMPDDDLAQSMINSGMPVQYHIAIRTSDGKTDTLVLNEVYVPAPPKEEEVEEVETKYAYYYFETSQPVPTWSWKCYSTLPPCWGGPGELEQNEANEIAAKHFKSKFQARYLGRVVGDFTPSPNAPPVKPKF